MRNLLSYAFVVGVGVSCGSAQDGSNEQTGGNDNGADAIDAARPRDGGNNGVVFLREASVSDAETTTPNSDEACAAVTQKAEEIPLDIVMMMDQSASMNTSVADGVQWNLVVSALRSFITDPRSQGIGVSLQYFGIDSGDFDWFGLVDTTSCDRATYANPDVPLTTLPSGANALLQSLDRHHPAGMSPTAPALLGALDYASAWATKSPTHNVVVLLATDGVPSNCSSTVEQVAASARARAQATPKILTYVVGVGPEVASLDEVAVAGGTKKAFQIDTTQNTTDKFLAALNEIRTSALGCKFSLPAPKTGEQLDFDKVNVVYTSGGGERITIPGVATGSECDPARGGWYYDDPSKPTTVNLCVTTCTEVKADTAGRIDTLVGCQRRVDVR